MATPTTYPALRRFVEEGRDGSRRRIAHETYAVLHEDRVGIVYHATEVVSVHADGSYTLNSGGYRTATTKARMGEFTPDGVSVYQSKHEWFVRLNGWGEAGQTFPYADGFRLVHGEAWGQYVPA